MNSFNLLEYQQLAREISSPRKLYDLWQEVCRMYERGLIGLYHLEEMKEVIMPNLKALSYVQHFIDGEIRPLAS